MTIYALGIILLLTQIAMSFVLFVVARAFYRFANESKKPDAEIIKAFVDQEKKIIAIQKQLFGGVKV